MRKQVFFVIMLALLSIFSVKAIEPELSIQVVEQEAGGLRSTSELSYVIRGNEGSVSFIISATGLNPNQTIKIKVPTEFTADKTELPYNAQNVEVVVKLKATKPVSEGYIYIIAGTHVETFHIIGYASPLPEKDLAVNPIYQGGNDAEFAITDGEGFTPTAKGYTLEFSAKTPASISYIKPFAITTEGVGLQSTITNESFTFNNSTLGWMDKIFHAPNGAGIFYPDDKFHTYRFAVASDNRVHVYRDAVLIDYVRTHDFGLQPNFQDGAGDYEENLLTNGNFEGEYEYIADDPASKILGSLEGWNIAANDRWNSEQFIENQEIDQESGSTNHVLRVQRYAWQNGWGAAEYSQIIDVVPGETYSFSALAKGGYSSRVGGYLGSLRIQEVKGTQTLNEKKIDITSDDWQEYSLDYTTSAAATQIRTVIYLEKGDTWSQNAEMYVDNAKLTGQRAAYQQKIGFSSRFAEIEYFNYDATGAYAPPKKELVLSTNKITINGTDKTATLTVNPVGFTEDVTLTPTNGFSVSPEIIPGGSPTTVTVTYNSSLDKTTGRIILRGGYVYAYVDLTGIGTPLETKDLSENPIYPGGNDAAFSISDGEGFTPTNKGFTLEVSVKTPTAISYLNPYAITTEGVGFQGFIQREAIGISNSTLGWMDKLFTNKASLNGTFYPDDEFHTLRYAVTSDNRVWVYRDGDLLDIVRAHDFGLQPSFQDGAGDFEENLLVNGDFEGEYAYIADDPASKILGSLEGWNIAANDRWNSEQFVETQEIGQEYDFNNHVLRVQRYAWQNGWGAAEYSQIIDVVPGETYSFSALAKGGYSSRVGGYLGSLRIQEVKGTQTLNEKKIDITSDDWQEYSLDYTTSAAATQIRTVIYLEKGDTWSQNAEMYVDNAKLTGQRAAYQQKIGFDARFAEIGYFNFDITGAYAPIFGIIIDPHGETGLNNLSGDKAITASVRSGLLYLNNVSASSAVSIYNASGSLIKKVNSYTGGIALPQKGFYIAVIKNGKDTQSVKVVY